MSIQHPQAASPTNALARGEAIGDGRAGPGHGEPRAEEEARRRGAPPPCCAGRWRPRPAMRRLLYVLLVSFLPRCNSRRARVPPVAEHARPCMSLPSSSGMPSRNSEEAKLLAVLQSRDVRVPRRRSPLRTRGFSPRHGDTAPPASAPCRPRAPASPTD